MASAKAPVHRFQPSNGQVLGYLGIAVLVLAAGYVLAVDRSPRGIRTVLGIGFAVVLVWVTLVRPRAVVYADTLVLRNPLSDVHIPLALVDFAEVSQTLNVWTGDRRWVCIGIGRSTRSLVRSGRGGAGPAGAPAYQDFVAGTITEMASAARREGRAGPGGGGAAAAEGADSVRRTRAWPEIAALGVTGAGFAVSLLL